MDLAEFVKLIQDIVKESCELKNRFTDQRSASVNYACIFCQNQEEYDEFFGLARQMGKILKETPTGPLFHIKDLETVSGELKLLKIRKPDETRVERGDADFTVNNYSDFKKRHINKPGFKLIRREGFEMIELVDKDFNTRAYFSNPPLDQQLRIK